MSFLWHDYETFGTQPAFDRPCQFAAIRTDEQLRETGQTISVYCQPPRDALPHPMACLVTGITPQHALKQGVIEADFADLIYREMMEPGTCSTGYNSLRFDDQVSRFLFYRNFYDPYEREYKNGNSRWDLIGLARMCYALRPRGIEWPLHKPGQPSFKLEDLTAANGIEHSGAHDALVDVRATIALAKVLRKSQPRLFDWALGLRNQAAVLKMLDTAAPEPLLHTSGRIPANRGCTSAFLPLAVMPERKKSVICFDLMSDPTPLLELSAEDIADRLFTPTADLPDDIHRIPLKTITANQCPMLAPMAVLRGVDTDRIGLDPQRCRRHAEALLEHLPALKIKLLDVYQPTPLGERQDVDAMLYSGGFFSSHDRKLMNRLRSCNPVQLASQSWPFEDRRLEEMLFRYRARNYPDSLTAEEWAQWEQQRLERLAQPPEAGQLSLQAFSAELELARESTPDEPAAAAILDQTEAWVLDISQAS